MSPLVEINNLTKRFKSITAVDNLSLSILKQDIYGFLGPNGSGKSTTIRLILTLLKSNAGSIRIFGLPLNSNKKTILSRIGAFVEKPDFYDNLSAFKNLKILAYYSNTSVSSRIIEETLDLVGLLDRSKSKVKTFSKGMKQRLGIAQAILHDPELLILDEPASGLDPSGMRDIRNLIRFLNKERNKTIILSSHNLQEIEMIANRMVIINKGEKIVEGEVAKLLDTHSYYTVFEVNNNLKAKDILEESTFKFEKIEIKENKLHLFCQRKYIPQINTFLVNNEIEVESIKVEQNLEDYFLTLT